jgi:hypothetical protein
MKRPWYFGVTALALLGIAAWLFSRSDAELPEPPRPRVAFRRYMSKSEFGRLEARRTLDLPIGSEIPPARDHAAPRDPVLVALSGKPGTTAVVIEANAVRNMPVGDLLVSCLQRKDRRNGIQKLKEEMGLDVFNDVDRVAMSDGSFVVSGNFGNTRWDQILTGMSSTAYGTSGRIYQRTDGVVDQQPIAVWNGQMVILGSTPADLQKIIDRLEGRLPPEAPVIPEEASYGEVYGVLSPSDLAGILPPEAANLAQRIQAAAQRIEIHADAAHDVAMTAQVEGPDPQMVQDLGQMLGTALSLGRFRARAEGDANLAELLEYANVSPNDGRFVAEIALPLAVIEKQLAFCKETP